MNDNNPIAYHKDVIQFTMPAVPIAEVIGRIIEQVNDDQHQRGLGE